MNFPFFPQGWRITVEKAMKDMPLSGVIDQLPPMVRGSVDVGILKTDIMNSNVPHVTTTFFTCAAVCVSIVVCVNEITQCNQQTDL